MNQAIIRMGQVRSAQIIYELLVVVPWFSFFSLQTACSFQEHGGGIHSRE